LDELAKVAADERANSQELSDEEDEERKILLMKLLKTKEDKGKTESEGVSISTF